MKVGWLYVFDKDWISSRTLRNRLIEVVENWKKIQEMNNISTDEEMFDYIFNIMLKDLVE